MFYRLFTAKELRIESHEGVAEGHNGTDHASTVSVACIYACELIIREYESFRELSSNE